MKKLLLIIALLPLMAFGQSGGNRQIKQVNSGLAGNGICVVIVDNNGQIQSIAKGVNGEVLSLDENDSLGFFSEIDPIYSADSGMIVFFADTVTKIATKADIQTIISVGAYILNNQSSAQTGNIWIGKTTDTAYKGLVIQNKKTLATNNENQIVLGNGSTLLGASDRTYYLTNKMTSATAAQFALKYWNGTATFTPFVVNSDQTVTFDSTITVSNGILDTHAATVGQMRDSISDFINQPTATTADNRLLKTVGTSGRNLEQTGVLVNDDNSIVTEGYIQAGKDTTYAGLGSSHYEILNVPEGNIFKYNYTGNNIGIGIRSLERNTSTLCNGFGYYALYNNKGNNSNGFGNSALQNNTGSNSNGFGNSALQNNTGNDCNGYGYKALYGNTGSYANGFGYFALYNNKGNNSNGFGNSALQNNTGSNSNGFGSKALDNNTGANSNGLGNNSLYGNTGSYANGFGYYALYNNKGNNSNGFGFASLHYNKGNHSNGFGYNSLYANAGDSVVGIGNNTLMYVKRTSYNLVGIGQGAAKGLSGDSINAVNAVAIGANSTINASNSINLGDVSVNKLYMANKEVFYQPLQYGTAGTSGQLLVASGINSTPAWAAKSTIALTAFDSTGFRVKPSQITGFSESDPVWTSASTNYYTKTNMQNDGTSQLHFNNLTNKPTTLSGYGITDGITASSSNTLTNKSGNISMWTNNSGYLTSQTSHADVVVDGDFISQGIMLRGASSGTYSILTNNSTNWNTAYSWGNHASAGYISASTPSNGDILYYNSGWQKLAKGSDGEVLTLASGIPDWGPAEGGSSLWENDAVYTDYIKTKSSKSIKVSSSIPSFWMTDATTDFFIDVRYGNTTINSFEASIGSGINIGSGSSGKVGITKNSSLIYEFPTDNGDANQVLQTDGSGTLSWATVSTGGGDMLKDIYDTDGDGKVQDVNATLITDKEQISSGLAATDELLLSDSGVLKKLRLSDLKTWMGAGGTATNLTRLDGKDRILIISDTGADVYIPAATNTTAGLMTDSVKVILNSVRSPQPQSVTTLMTLGTYCNFTTTVTTDVSIQFKNEYDGATGTITAYYYGSGGKITFTSYSSYTVNVAENIYDSNRTVLTKSSGVAVYSYYIYNNNIYINGTQTYR